MLESGQDVFITIIAALSAIVTVIMAAAIAPTHKTKIAWVTFMVGALLAAAINKPESFAAIIAGFVCSLVISIYLRSQAPNKSFNRTPRSGAA